VALQIPIGAEANFKGVVDLIEMKAILWHDETMGAEFDIEPIPADLQKKAEAFRLQLIESSPRPTMCCWRSSWKARRRPLPS
jgi:elongation factor G